MEGLTMKKWWVATPLVVGLLLLAVTPSYAWRGHHFHGGPRVFVGVGVGPWWGYPYWYYPPPYYYYAPPPTVVVQQPPVYVEQQGPVAPAPPMAPAPSVQAPQYWYYCQPSGGYYPSVQTCTEAWIKVPARPQ